MLIRIAPPPPTDRPNAPQSAVWINTEYIAEAHELRNREPNDEPIAFRLVMASGEQHYIDVARAGRGAAEQFFAWLNQQQKLPKVEIPKPLDKGGKGKGPAVESAA